MTAFYMGRLMIYTFFGPNRTGEAERAHLHEAAVTHDDPADRAGVRCRLFGGFLNVESTCPIVTLVRLRSGRPRCTTGCTP